MMPFPYFCLEYWWAWIILFVVIAVLDIKLLTWEQPRPKPFWYWPALMLVMIAGTVALACTSIAFMAFVLPAGAHP